MTAGGALRVALGEYDTGWHDPATSLVRAGAVIERAARARARLVVLPEMATTGFTMDAAGQATSIGGDVVARLRDLARMNAVWLIAGVALRSDGAPHALPETGAHRASNAALVIDPAGELVAAYHKQRCFAYAGEHQSYDAGESPAVVTIDGVRVAPFICYDLRFPELFRAVAGDVDLIVLIANWPAVRRTHWDVLVRARAIENLAYVVAVNRIGEGDGIAYDGGSVAYDPWGERLAGDTGALQVVEVSRARVAEVRGRYPFLADRA